MRNFLEYKDFGSSIDATRTFWEKGEDLEHKSGGDKNWEKNPAEILVPEKGEITWVS